MKCLSCSVEIPPAFFDMAESINSGNGLFRCPHCGATHLRRVSNRTADGTPSFDVRLWGHPATTRRRIAPAVPKPSGGPKNGVAV